MSNGNGILDLWLREMQSPKTTRLCVPFLQGIKTPWPLEALLYHPSHFLFLRW